LKPGESPNQTDLNLIRILSAVTSTIVVIMNKLLGRIIREFSAYEKHWTYTKYNLSVASKLTLVMISLTLRPCF
jgi:hypothetical protein